MIARRVATGLAAVGAVFAVAQLALIVAAWSHPDIGRWSPRDVAVLQMLNGVASTIVGTVIVRKRPGNLVGWLLLTAGFVGLGWWLANEYAAWGLIVRPGSLPGVQAAALLSEFLWLIPFSCIIVMLLVFPAGRLLSRAWWPAVAAAVAGMALVVPLLITLWRVRPEEHLELVAGDSAQQLPTAAVRIDVVLSVCLGASLLAAVASVVVRWRRSGGVERLQVKWLMFAGAVVLTSTVLDYVSRWARLALALALLSIPVAIGVAVLQYRLYEIDRVISRTVTYAIVSTLVIGAYVVVVVLPSVLFDVESDLLVAAATLVAAGAFRPVRERVRAAVDRRFNRSRYDARATAEAFSIRLRQDLDIDDLAADMLRVVEAAVQPTHAGLLLRRSGCLTPLTSHTDLPAGHRAAVGVPGAVAIGRAGRL